MGNPHVRWTDERGDIVEIFQYFSELYVDKESRRLSRIYCVHDCPNSGVPSSLGKGEPESLVCDLFKICKSLGNDFVGFEESELETFVKLHQATGSIGDLKSREYLREKWVKGKKVLFLTEKLLENQKVRKY